MLAAIAAATTIGACGSYIEIRTCSIFAGPCHFNSEIMNEGRGAIVVVAFDLGRFGPTDVAGLKAAAVILADGNLLRSTDRKSVIYVDTRATEEQSSALAALILQQSGIVLGQTIAIRRASINVDVQGLVSKVKVVVDGEVVAHGATSGAECHSCSMPGVLWYEPLANGASVQVATVEEQAFYDPILGETWTRHTESAAFVGRFVW